MTTAFVPILVLALLAGVSAAPLSAATAGASSTNRPLPPEYRIHADGSVTQRLCFNWSCASRQQLTFTAADMTEVARQMAACPGAGMRDRVQRLRIGIWQMQVLAQKYQPLLANDTAINEADYGLEGRMDCIDSASNTASYLAILRELGLLSEWSMAAPEVRDRFSGDVHWTAVVDGRENAGSLAVDSWFRPNGHLPFVMPLADWERGRPAWEPPFDGWNSSPRHISELCGS